MSSVKIVSGHNGTPIELQLISPPLLALFAGAESIETEWHDYISREQAGDRNWVEIGKAWCKWKFFRLSRDEYALLAPYTGDVTIVTLNQTTGVYHTYNASCKPMETNTDARWAADSLQGFSDCVITFYDLEQIV